MMESHQMKGRCFLWAFAGGPPFTWLARKKNTAQEPIELENIELPVSAW